MILVQFEKTLNLLKINLLLFSLITPHIILLPFIFGVSIDIGDKIGFCLLYVFDLISIYYLLFFFHIGFYTNLVLVLFFEIDIVELVFNL